MGEDSAARPTFSVIVATHNSAATLPRTLASLRAQTGANLEVLVSDGGSSDQTMTIVSSFPDIVSWYQSAPDRGVYDAWNKAIPHAKAEWIMFLGSDDWLERDDVLQNLAELVERIPPDERRLSYVFGQTRLVEADGQTIELLGAEPIAGERLGLNDNPGFSHTGLLHHRSLFEQFGLFDPDFRSAGDYEFLLRTAADPNVCFRHVPLTIAQMAAGGMSTSAHSRMRHMREVLLARRKLGLAPLPLWLAWMLFRAKVLEIVSRSERTSIAHGLMNIYRLSRGKGIRGRLS